MNKTALLNILPSVGNLPPSTKLKGALIALPASTGLFSTQLASTLATAAKKTSGAATADPSVSRSDAIGDSSPALANLQTQIAAALNAGQSLSSIIANLSASLATSVAAKLGTTSEGARTRLQSAFASALSPPGQTGPPLTTAQQAQTLAQTFLQVASVATGVANGESGQQNRFLGTDLDAATAKANPAPTTTPPTATAQNASVVPVPRTDLDSTLRSATTALAKLTAPAASSFAAASPQGDGRSVALPDPALAQTTGGDTLLGRVLTRATLAASSVPGTGNATPSTTAATLASAISESGANGLSAAALNVTGTLPGLPSPQSQQIAAAGVPTSNPAIAPQSGINAFLQAFTSALSSATSTAAAAKHDTSEKEASLDRSLLLPGASSPASSSTFVPSVPAFSISQSGPATAGIPQASAPAGYEPVDTSAIVEQVLRGAFMQTNGTLSQIRLQLDPAHLGEVSVKLNVDSSGNVSAHVLAQTADVRDALISGQQQLTRSLADAGMKLSSFTVDVSGGGLGGNANGQNGQSQQPSTGRPALVSGIDAEGGSSDEAALLAEPTFGPPLVASRSLGNLNQLA